MLSNAIDFFDDESVLNAKGTCGSSCGGEAKVCHSFLSPLPQLRYAPLSPKA